MKIFIKKKKAHVLTVVFCFFILAYVAWAAVSDGTIDSVEKYAWSENIGWINFGSNPGNVHITDSELSGYAWAENASWISLNCSNDSSCGVSNYKVANDGGGNLSGFAWGENIGWINFAPINGGVQIDSSGIFSGYAWGENIGWVIFGCSTDNSCGSLNWGMETDWRPESVRETDNDEENLEIHNVKYSATAESITVEWETNNDADSRVRYGIVRTDLQNEEKDNDENHSHKIILKNLASNMEYYFKIKSTDENDDSDSTKI